jgi:hypothetical protein
LTDSACAFGLATGIERDADFDAIKPSDALFCYRAAAAAAFGPGLRGELAKRQQRDTERAPGIPALLLTGSRPRVCSVQNLKASEALGTDIVADVMPSTQ